MWCVGELDDEYISKMEDVLKTYEKPLSESEPVVCVDEKPVVLHEDTRPMIPMQPGQVARRDYEYKRCGTANVFCGIEPKAGIHFTKVTPTRSSPEFAAFILEVAAHYPAADTIHLILDNWGPHTRTPSPPAATDWSADRHRPERAASRAKSTDRAPSRCSVRRWSYCSSRVSRSSPRTPQHIEGRPLRRGPT